MMKRRFRRKASWIWADRNSFQAVDGAAVTWQFAQILPAGRVKWLCDNAKRSHITTKRILLWLDWQWQNPSTTTSKAIPDCDFFVIRSQQDEGPNIEFEYDPFVQPQPPAALTGWGVSPSDGLDPFLWCHHIKGTSPPNSTVNTFSTASGTQAANQANFISFAASGGPDLVCRKFMVAAEWQPDVIIKSRRRLAPNQGLVLGMRFPGTNTGITGLLSWNVRILA